MNYAVEKRFGRELWDIRQFVQPNTPGVVALAGSLPAHPKERFIEAAWNWVVNNIKYPPGDVEVEDRHYLEAYTGRAKQKYLTHDFWNFPAETLSKRYGDCDDVSILLVSILRNRLPESEVFVSVGTFAGYGHAWVTLSNGYVLEATALPEAAHYVAVRETGSPYRPLLRFNDRKVVILSPQLQVARGKKPKLAALRTWYRALNLTP